MASLNRVILLGNLGQDPEMRMTPSQTQVVTLNVATTDYRTVDGQKQETTDWHRVVVWGKQAENCHRYLRKGSSVLIEGKIQTRSWDDQATGSKRYITEVVAQNIRFVGGRRDAGASDNAFTGEDLGGSPSPSQGNYNAMSSAPSLDDIPF